MILYSSKEYKKTRLKYFSSEIEAWENAHMVEVDSAIALTINHNNSDISFLESFTFNKDSLPMALKQLKMINGVDECFILSTCNRVEAMYQVRIKILILK